MAVKSQEVFDEFKTLSGSVVHQCVFQAMPALLLPVKAVEEATKHLGFEEQSKYTGFHGHTSSNILVIIGYILINVVAEMLLVENFPKIDISTMPGIGYKDSMALDSPWAQSYEEEQLVETTLTWLEKILGTVRCTLQFMLNI